ncbi:hypothetical protein [Kitasatospora sp. NPDC056531]|uniref:hypothetical protein n=1 Tax=Kitasatospora sp. NPDC056531 TaxID=3345856 RepID=UPI00368832BE
MYSISLPESLAETVRVHVGPGEFSAYVAEAFEQRVAMDKVRETVFSTDFAQSPSAFRSAQEMKECLGSSPPADPGGSAGQALPQPPPHLGP